jgi:hypothetical protein
MMQAGLGLKRNTAGLAQFRACPFPGVPNFETAQFWARPIAGLNNFKLAQ